MSRRTSATLLALLICLCSASQAANFIWLETERFDRPGGWTTDSQFIDQMGSPYLMAIGLGEPVEDAATTAKLPGPGRYRLWARTKDWAPEHHPGRFQIILDGKPIDRTFGATGPRGWRWEDGGLHELAGTAEIRLHDLTGYYGRCDVIVLCDDPKWIPPEDKEAIAELREKHGGVSRQVKDMGSSDVVVVGGGLAGCMAAVSAARLGCRTVLIQNRPVLGGNASVEILVPPVGVWPGKQGPLDPRETGLIGEIRTRGNQTTEEAKLYSGRLMRLVKLEPNLDLHLNTHATGVEMAEAPGQGGRESFSAKRPQNGGIVAGKRLPTPSSRIAAVLAVNVRSGRRMRFAGRLFIDCTGDAAIGVAAGAEHRHGREGRSTYGESMAPEVGDNKTMGNSLKYVSQPTDSPRPFEAPAWAMKFPTCDSFTPGRHPLLTQRIGWQWKIELGGTRDTYRNAEEIRDDLLRLIYGIWDHVKNHCDKHREKAANHKLVWVGHVAGKRENRRLIGDYVLTGNDIVRQTLFPDRVAYGGWSLDDHHPGGFFRKGHTMRIPLSECCIGRPYSIPYRSLYSKNIGNLLMAGRDISASHMGLSNTRVMLTCAVIGQASGTAAGMCIKHDTTPRGIYQNHIEKLQQQLLKDGAHVFDLPNRDPRDLARAATVSASSEKTRDGGEVLAAANVTNGYARAAGGKTNAWFPKPGDSPPPWIELAWSKPRTFNVVHVIFPTKNHAPARFQVQARREGVWKTLAEQADCRHQRYVLGLDRTTASRLRVVLLGKQRLDPAVSEVRVYDEPARVVEIARRAAANMVLPDDKPDLPWDDSLDGITGFDPRKLPGIVVDDTKAEAVGHWVESTFGEHYILRGYRHDGNDGKGDKQLRFQLDVPKAGRYEIRLAYSAYPNRATNTPVTVRTAGGSKTIRLDQRRKPSIDGLFHSLGVFALEAGLSSSVVVGNDGTDGYVVADAIQLLPVK